MININKPQLSQTNNNLTLQPVISKSRKINIATTWCNIIRVENSYDLSEKYQDICQSHHHDSKWILMINPESDSLEQLSTMGKINPEKILKVNASKVNVSLAHIKSALLKGNCSAMILSNAQYNQAELNEISRCAAQGKTQCILLQNSSLKLTNQLH